MEAEQMTLDEYIKANKEIKLSTSPGSVAMSMRSGFSLGRGARRAIGPPVKPLEYDWTWSSGEEVKEREVPLPRTFFRGRGGWKARGFRGRGFYARGRGRGFQRFNNFAHRPYLTTRPFFRRGRGSRGFSTFHGRGFHSQVNFEGKLPVHQRLGWLTPARRYALQSVKAATRNLNRVPFNANQHCFLNSGNRNMARFQLLRQYRNMHEDADDDTGSMITVSVNNELATARRGRGSFPMRARGQRGGRGFSGARFGSQLSQQNVARLPGHAASVSNSNSSWSSVSQRGFRPSKNHRNRHLYSERQLPGSRHMASLQSVRRNIRPAGDMFLVPAVPIKVHAVKLDKSLQLEIKTIQESAANGTFMLEYKPLSTNTTTSTSDRFSLMA